MGGGPTEDSSGSALDAAEASPFTEAPAAEESAFWGSAPDSFDSTLSPAAGRSRAPSDAVSDSRSKRTFNMLPRLRAEGAGAGVATQPPGGAGVWAGRVLARENVEGGVASPLSEEVDELKSGGGAELDRSTGSLMS